MRSKPVLSRRNALSAAGAGLAWLGSARRAAAADWTPAEQANVRVVNDFLCRLAEP